MKATTAEANTAEGIAIGTVADVMNSPVGAAIGAIVAGGLTAFGVSAFWQPPRKYTRT